MTKIIGLTGPTGAGKSTVSQLFVEQGCSIIDCDKVAREVTNYNVDCLKELCYAFGSDLVNKHGNLNRALLAQRAFVNRQQTQKLNGITHPFILKEIAMLIKQHEQQGVKVLIIDAPLLFESGLQTVCHQTISVLAPQQVRLKRIMERDNITKEQALLRICAQPEEAFYKERSNIIIDGCLHSQQISNQITDLLREV